MIQIECKLCGKKSHKNWWSFRSHNEYVWYVSVAYSQLYDSHHVIDMGDPAISEQQTNAMVHSQLSVFVLPLVPRAHLKRPRIRTHFSLSTCLRVHREASIDCYSSKQANEWKQLISSVKGPDVALLLTWFLISRTREKKNANKSSLSRNSNYPKNVFVFGRLSAVWVADENTNNEWEWVFSVHTFVAWW